MADIIAKIAAIRAAIFGKDVRENIASGIESINAEVINTTTRQVTVEGKQSTLETIFNGLIINAGSSNAEIVAARNGEVSLPVRLAKVDTQLADKMKKGELYFNVRDYGAVDNGLVTENTQAFKDALAAAALVCGNVFVPPSDKGYWINGDSIDIPEGVTLFGYSVGYNGVWVLPGKGSTLLITGNQDNEFGNSVFIMKNGSEFKGLSIVYPNQTETNPPIGFPFLISGSPSNCNDVLIEDIFLYNCLKFADFSMPHQRLVIKNIYGDALKTGIIVDNCWDVDRIENIHLWPYFTDGKTSAQQIAMATYKANFAKAIILGQADGIQGGNIFAYGYSRGLVLGIDNRAPYGQFDNVSLDICSIGIETVCLGNQGLVIDNYAYAMNPTLQVAYSIPNTFALAIGHIVGTLQVDNSNIWGGPNKAIYINPSFGALSKLRMDKVNIAENQDAQFIYNAGMGEVVISDLKSKEAVKMLFSEVGSSQVIFENPMLNNENYDGTVLPIIKKYNFEELRTVASAFTIYIQSSKKIKITGTTAIENIDSSSLPGSELLLIFTSNVSLMNGTYNLRLASQFNATANDTLTLIFDGVNWLEKSRSVNI